MSDSWKTAGFGREALNALEHGLAPSALWSLLMNVMAQRARRQPAKILEQWKRDEFTAPAAIDQRVFVELDRELLASAPQFEAVELSPVAPLGASSAVGLTTQNRVLSALRGCEVVSDPTNVLALECARRLQNDGEQPVRLATVHRCLRAQPFPKQSGFAAHFRIFCLATATPKGKDHDHVVTAMVEQISTHLNALDRLQSRSYRFPHLSVTMYATEQRASLADRICAEAGRPIARAELRHAYYDGLRFTIFARDASGHDIPISDGGVFDWLTRLTSNRRLALIASGMGTQLVAQAFSPRSQVPSR